MKRLAIVPIILLVVAATVFSQTDKSKQITEIRDYYATVSTEIEEIHKDEEAANHSWLAVNELVVNKLNYSWPAVGAYSVVTRFYYEKVGEEHYPNHLVKVTKETKSAARRIYQEWLFNDQKKLIFYFEKTDKDDEHRIYFADSKMIEFVGSEKPERSAAEKEQIVSAAKRESDVMSKLFDLSIQ